MPEIENPFFKKGLRFTCQQCSNCCRHEPGYVFLSRRDLEKISLYLKMSEEEAVHHYCRSVAVGGFSRLSLKEKSNYDCIFWENGRCLIYKARPLQCASYPFWAHHLYSEAVWKDLEKSCPGINKGRKHSMREINGWLEKRRKEPFINTGTIDESAEL